MGTSTSSSGGRAGTPFDPEWLPSPQIDGGDAGAAGEASSEDSNTSAEEDENAGEQDGSSRQGSENSDFAPNRRYAEARSKMSNFLSGGGREALHSATKSMINKAMGGSRRAASTMRGSAEGAAETPLTHVSRIGLSMYNS